MRQACLVLLLAACDSPSYRNGALKCAQVAPRCPNGYHCALDDQCWSSGSDPDLGLPYDAPVNIWAWQGYDLASTDLCAAPKCECGTIVTACGQFSCDLPDCSSKKQICNIVYPERCGCPPPGGRTAVYRNVSSDGTHHCLSSFGTGCDGYTAATTPSFYAYSGDPTPGLINFSGCVDPSIGWYTYLGLGCGPGADPRAYSYMVYFVPDGQMCDTVPLFRYKVATGEFDTLNQSEAPSGAVMLPTVYVWPTP
jgi:hypothetical protein